MKAMFFLVIVGLLAIALNLYVWVEVIPQRAMELHQMYADRHEPEEKCKPALPTPEDYERNGWDQYEYDADIEMYAEDADDADLTMPRPLLDCEAGDHTCID